MKKYFETQYSFIREELQIRLEKIFEMHNQYIMGPEVKQLEKTLADYVGCKHAISCSSGTDALLMALMAYGVGKDDLIITSPFSFVATAEVIALLGARPIFVDIDPVTFNMDLSKLQEILDDMKIRSPRGIISVDIFGQPSNYLMLKEIAKKYRLFLIGDCAQSFGSTVFGKSTLQYPDIACTSFFPSKPLGCYGDGGMCFTDNDILNEKLTSIRSHGKGTDKYDNVRFGINGRLDTLQAAVLLTKFEEVFDYEIKQRQYVAEIYDKLLLNNKNLHVQMKSSLLTSAHAQYAVFANSSGEREMYRNKLKNIGVESPIYYPIPLHLQSCFRSYGYGKGHCPVAEDICEKIFSLPMHPYLQISEQKRIVEVLNDENVDV